MKTISKLKLMAAIIEELEKELNVAIQAAKTAHEDATNEESKPENQYDTRALESSYIARGQAQRVAELKATLFELKNIELNTFTDGDPITATALIEVESNNKKNILFFLPKGGGFSVSIDGIKVQVVTPSTPLGQALLQTKNGDSVLVELGNASKEYEILDVI